MKEKTPFLQNEVNNILLFTYYANCNVVKERHSCFISDFRVEYLNKRKRQQPVKYGGGAVPPKNELENERVGVLT